MMMRFFLLLIPCLFNLSLNAQPTAQHPLIDAFKNDINISFIISILQEKSIITSPLHWSDKDWMTVALLTSSGGIIMGFDKELYQKVQQNKSKFGDKVAQYFAEPIGSGLLSLPLLAGLYAGGRLTHHERTAQAALAGTRAFVITALNVQILKMAIGRERPSESSQPYNFHGPSLHHDALPSGHKAVAFAMASAVAHSYPEKPLLGAGLYTVAALTAWSRINDGKHWPSDVFAGAVLGYFTGRLVAGKGQDPATMKHKVSYLPFFSPHYTGIMMTWNLR